jgi:general secretion pathway protein F
MVLPVLAEGVKLRVQSRDGEVRWLPFAGLDAAQATQQARQQGLRVLEIAGAPVAAAPPGVDKAFKADKAQRYPGGRTSSAFDLLLFSQELHSLLQAGLNLSEALDTLLAKAAGATRLLLADIVKSLGQGRNFSEVLASHGGEFPPVYVATVRSSERTGNLPEALARYIVYQQQFEMLRKKLVAAAIYPALLLGVGGFVTLFLLGYVVPRFASVYQSSARELPWMSSVLLSVGSLIHAHAMWMLAALVLAMVALVTALRRPAVRARLVNSALGIPGIADKADLFRLSRFYRALSLLLASGIALPRAMGMVGGLLGASQQLRLTQARLRIEQGETVSLTLVQAGLATPVAKSLIQVGERSGQLAPMLERTAQFHDEELTRWIDAASRLLEPLLMLAIGLVIGTVVVLMYLPIFELAGSFQ